MPDHHQYGISAGGHARDCHHAPHPASPRHSIPDIAQGSTDGCNRHPKPFLPAMQGEVDEADWCAVLLDPLSETGPPAPDRSSTARPASRASAPPRPAHGITTTTCQSRLLASGQSIRHAIRASLGQHGDDVGLRGLGLLQHCAA
jgi:hypothetical protein